MPALSSLENAPRLTPSRVASPSFNKGTFSTTHKRLLLLQMNMYIRKQILIACKSIVYTHLHGEFILHSCIVFYDIKSSYDFFNAK